MSDVTAQAFREAAGEWNDPHVNALLLAAAEQREQLDAERLVVDVITQKQQDQIATLTAERDEARATVEKVREWAEAFDRYPPYLREILDAPPVEPQA